MTGHVDEKRSEKSWNGLIVNDLLRQFSFAFMWKEEEENLMRDLCRIKED